MEMELNEVDVRVLGALIEKESTTPEYYPLSLNALVNACNQKSNRDPVVDYSEEGVKQSVESLREKKLTLLVTGAGGRVSKFKHTFANRFDVKDKEMAVLCILMLRGPQTVGEIRGRTGRLCNFGDLAEVTETLDGLINRPGDPYVLQLPRQPGRKEVRYAHLLLGQPDIPEESQDPTGPSGVAKSDRIAELEEELAALKIELETFKQEFVQFKKQFE